MLIVDGTIYSAHGFEDEESECYPSGVGSDSSVPYYWSQEES